MWGECSTLSRIVDEYELRLPAKNPMPCAENCLKDSLESFTVGLSSKTMYFFWIKLTKRREREIEKLELESQSLR
jgi:hypothetical protein